MTAFAFPKYVTILTLISHLSRLTPMTGAFFVSISYLNNDHYNISTP